ncbi:Claudin-18, partial [Eschrichtius robustus]|nr:Claudin-18 [Eschrichtius robustus]
MLQAVRALMIVGIVLSVIGLLVAIFALKCIRIGNMDDSAKAKMTLTSGIMFIISGLCAIAGVSVFANMLVTNFWMSTANMYTSMGGMVQTVQTSYKAVSYHASGHNVAYRPGGFKASTGFESNTKTKKIYDGGARTEDEGQSYPSKYDYV